MTETEWLVGTRPGAMLECLGEMASSRKMRLFACGCTRILWVDLVDDRSRHAVLVSECYADGFATRRELSRAWRESHAAYTSIWNTRKWLDKQSNYCAHPHSQAAFNAQFACAMPCELVATYLNPDRGRMAEGREAQIIRELFGNPFRPANFDPLWLTSTVVSLAEGIYQDRAFDRLPILADALQDAGCDNADILSHCRSDGPHVRGCWVVDLLLGKK